MLQSARLDIPVSGETWGPTTKDSTANPFDYAIDREVHALIDRTPGVTLDHYEPSVGQPTPVLEFGLDFDPDAMDESPGSFLAEQFEPTGYQLYLTLDEGAELDADTLLEVLRNDYGMTDNVAKALAKDNTVVIEGDTKIHVAAVPTMLEEDFVLEGTDIADTFIRSVDGPDSSVLPVTERSLETGLLGHDHYEDIVPDWYARLSDERREQLRSTAEGELVERLDDAAYQQDTALERLYDNPEAQRDYATNSAEGLGFDIPDPNENQTAMEL